MSLLEIGCCGAYCRTCPALIDSTCCGCKLGYKNGKRDIDKAKCKIKICCFKERNFETCADCPDYTSCKIIQGFYDKSGYKYKRYRQALEYIRDKGYDSFIERADRWNGPYGKL